VGSCLASPYVAAPGRLLLITTERRRGWALERTLTGLAPHVMAVVHVGVPRGPAAAGARAYDLVAVDVCAGAGAALAFGVDLLAASPGGGILFFCDDPALPEIAALRALGVTPLIVGAGARDWVVAAAAALVKVGRARRALALAEAAVPAFDGDLRRPRGGPTATSAFAAGGRPLPLPIAEGRFRETYLRALLATAGSRGRAAQRAGISYRSLCRIAQTLGIDVPRPPALAPRVKAKAAGPWSEPR